MAAGRKTGGRKAGTLNKRTVALPKAAEIIGAGETPLEFLTSVYRDAGVPLDMRIDAAGKAAGYVHPRLGAVTLKGDEDNPLQIVGRIDMVPVDPEPRE